MEEKRVIIKCVDMREDLQKEAVSCASEVCKTSLTILLHVVC